MIVQIKEILNEVLKESPGMPRVLEEHKIANAWGKINQANVAENSSPEKLVGGVLHVNAKNSAWAQQISISKAEIISKLNASLGDNTIRDIRTKTGIINEPAKKKEEGSSKICGACGVEFRGEGGLCATCLRQTGQERTIKIIRLVESSPRVRIEQAKEFIPGITEEELRKARRNVAARKADQNYRERRQRGR